MEQHTHPTSGVLIDGTMLVAGAILREDDKYNSADGAWRKCPCPGIVLGRTNTIWVRPSGLSLNAQYLLAYLSQRESGLYSYVTKRAADCRGWVVVPGPNFNWDPRVQTPTVLHPECLQELADCGLLSFNVGRQLYSLTEDGKRKGRELFCHK